LLARGPLIRLRHLLPSAEGRRKVDGDELCQFLKRTVGEKAEVKRTEVKRTEVKRTEVKRTEVKRTEVKKTEVKKTEVKRQK
jgi:hypothetical protein